MSADFRKENTKPHFFVKTLVFLKSGYCLAELDVAVRNGVNLVPVNCDARYNFGDTSKILEQLPDLIGESDYCDATECLQHLRIDIFSVSDSFRKLLRKSEQQQESSF